LPHGEGTLTDKNGNVFRVWKWIDFWDRWDRGIGGIGTNWVGSVSEDQNRPRWDQ
jgi:hypothetical protein